LLLSGAFVIRSNMKTSLKKIWARVGITGLIIAVLFGNLIYMNLRPADPIITGWEEYTPARFEELMAKKELVLVEIYASWCPTCLLQHKAFETLVNEGNFPPIRAIRVDYDRDTDFIAQYRMQGTGLLVLFKNGQEVSRAAGLVTSEKISMFLQEFL